MGTFVVVGAAKPGIGEAICRDLATAGHKVLGTGEVADAAMAEALRREFPAVQIDLIDHSDIEKLRQFVASAPRALDGVAIAQMLFDIRSVTDFDQAMWTAGLTVNLTMPHYLSIELAPRINVGGGIVTVTSTEGFVGSFGAAGYAATKAAVHNLVKTHANNFGPLGVRCNAVAAGWIGGVMDTDEVFNMSRRITPLGRLGTPAEIASVVRFLLSQDASFITGATIVADGGYTCVDSIAKYEYEAMTK